jgi:uncharacterized protein (TIGR02246 family)
MSNTMGVTVNDEEEIRNLLDTWMTATKAGDSETVLGLMTDDVVFLVSGQEPFGKTTFAKASDAQSDASVAFDGMSEIMELKILGDWAYMLTKLRVSASQPGKAPMMRSGHTLTILRKDDGKWKIARDANLLVPVEASGNGV